MKRYVLIAVTAISLLGCSGNKQADATKTNDTGKTVQAPDTHNAENALDYYGVYEGTYPAADCPGIEMTLVLNKDNTFTLRSVYIDRKDATFDDKGTFTLDGNILTLKVDDGSFLYYKLEEGRVHMLGQDKQPATGPFADQYVLNQKKVF